MTLAVRKTGDRGPQRILLYGLEGIGKTTWAAGFPRPVFLGSEDGFGDLSVDAMEAPQNWGDVLHAIDALTREPHDYRTLVIDTIDHLERVLWTTLAGDKGSIEEVGGGFGKGYIAAVEKFEDLRAKLDTLRERRKMHIVLLGHAHLKTFRNPEGPDYERFTLKMHEKAAALWREWVDILLFAQQDIQVKSSERGDKALFRKGKAVDAGKGGESRSIATTRTPAYDAKNRYDLPNDIDMPRRNPWGPFGAAMKFAEIEARLELVQLRERLERELRAAGAAPNDVIGVFGPAAGWTAEVMTQIRARFLKQQQAEPKKGKAEPQPGTVQQLLLVVEQVIERHGIELPCGPQDCIVNARDAAEALAAKAKAEARVNTIDELSPATIGGLIEKIQKIDADGLKSRLGVA